MKKNESEKFDYASFEKEAIRHLRSGKGFTGEYFKLHVSERYGKNKRKACELE